ncbi:MAG: hypothetical protein ACPGQS_01065 [Bradymonadia bacterium]
MQRTLKHPLSRLLYYLTLLHVFSMGCAPEEPKTLNVSIVTSPYACTLGLTEEDLAGQPCVANQANWLREVPLNTQVGCYHVKLADWFQTSPIVITEGSDDFERHLLIEEFESPSFGLEEHPFAGLVGQWLFLPGSTPQDCDRLNLWSTCQSTEGCTFAVGPVGAYPASPEDQAGRGQYLLDGRNQVGQCQYSTQDGFGLTHPEACDGRDNNCDGQIDNAPMCAPEPAPLEDGECGDSRDCDVTQPLCIDGQCRGCEPGLLECNSPNQSVCDVSGICRGCMNDEECGDDATCDRVTGVCVQCQADADCPAHAPFCEADGQCAGCDPFANGQCPAGESCLANGSCGGCASDIDCPVNSPLCNLETNQCEGCVSFSDCPGNTGCYENRCRECGTPGRALGECFNHDSPICDADSYTCRSCRSDDECGEDSYCYLGACELCNPQTNAGCEGTGFVCNPSFRSCTSCLSHAQCAQAYPNEPFCNAQLGRCAPCNPETNQGCTEDAPVCSTSDNSTSCGPCATDLDCANDGNTTCLDGRCVACIDDSDCGGERCAVISGTRTCVQCDPNRPEGENGCDAMAPVCSPNGTCGNCLTSQACPPRTPVCGDDYQCRTCATDGECAYQGLICGDGVCNTCDANRASPDNPDVHFGCTVEQPICRFGGARCTN